jgi:stage II sporulation protein M
MKPLSTKTQFKEAISYVRESKKYIYGSVFIFFISTIFGLVFRENLNFLEAVIERLIAKTADLNSIEIIFFILQNNLQSSLLAIVLGIFLGIFPLFSSLTNGLVLGYVLGRTLEITSIFDWWRLLPHGIFELPAIFISFGIGIKLGFSLFLKKGRRTKEFIKRFYNSFNVFLMIIIPLLIIAAIIEGLLIGLLS